MFDSTGSSPPTEEDPLFPSLFSTHPIFQQLRHFFGIHLYCLHTFLWWNDGKVAVWPWSRRERLGEGCLAREPWSWEISSWNKGCWSWNVISLKLGRTIHSIDPRLPVFLLRIVLNKLKLSFYFLLCYEYWKT